MACRWLNYIAASAQSSGMRKACVKPLSASSITGAASPACAILFREKPTSPLPEQKRKPRPMNWRRLIPLRFYRSQVCYSQHASAAWYVEWRGRGWSIEVTPVGPHLWQPDLSFLNEAADNRRCTCHPAEAPVPCARRYALSECIEYAANHKLLR